MSIDLTHDLLLFFVFFFKQKTAYEMRISDWSSDVCSSDLRGRGVSVASRNGSARQREHTKPGIGSAVVFVSAGARYRVAMARKPHARQATATRPRCAVSTGNAAATAQRQRRREIGRAHV